MKLAIIADDLTGACDTAAPFAVLGYTTEDWLASRSHSGLDVDVVAIDTDSRWRSVRAATGRTRLAVRAVRKLGAQTVFKKIDSTLRGHVVAEALAAQREFDSPFIVLTPAFPALGRRVDHGELVVEGRGPIGRVRELIELPASPRTVEMGPSDSATELEERLRALHADGAQIIIANATRQEHLRALAGACLALPRPPLLAGSGGLGSAVASVLADDKGRFRAAPEPPRSGAESPRGPRAGWLLVVGSLSPTASGQVARLASLGIDALRLDPAMSRSPRQLARVVGQLCTWIQAGAHAIVRLSPPASPSLNAPAEERAARLLGTVCRAVLQQVTPAGLLLSGGSTARACLTELGVHALRLEREVLPGVPLSLAVGGAWHGRPLITKAGAFGDADTLRNVLKAAATGA